MFLGDDVGESRLYYILHYMATARHTLKKVYSRKLDGYLGSGEYICIDTQV